MKYDYLELINYMGMKKLPEGFVEAYGIYEPDSSSYLMPRESYEQLLAPYQLPSDKKLYLDEALDAIEKDEKVLAFSKFFVFNMFLMRTYFSEVPDSLYEAARIDGASWFKIYWDLAVPLSKTAMLTVGMMYALSYWNDWWNALMFINNRDMFPLQYYLYNILSNVNAISSGRIPAGAAANLELPAETVKMAVTMITIGPIIFLYPFIQKYFVNGIMTGAVKE